MSGPIDRLALEYVAGLERYLRGKNELTLSYAYELGRRAMVDGLGVLDMAVLHRAAVRALVVTAPAADRDGFAEAAADFFDELLSPFEMSLRGYREANEGLLSMNETLRQQKEAVDTVNRELESFSYSVSHDLRAPLRSIDGFSQILLEDYSDALDQTGQRHLRHVREASQKMAQLIDDLLGLARVTRTEVHRVEVDLTERVCRIAARLRTAAPERIGAFIVEPGMQCNADLHLLEVLLENLLGNAWKFTSKRERAEIQVGREARDGVTAYFVRDNGAGFDMKYEKKLFGAFQRLHSARDFEGTGIGLATVQRVVYRHGGQVWAEAKVEMGATFYFTLGAGTAR